MNVHKDHRERMHRRFDETGFTGWSRYEVMEYMLYNVLARRDTSPIAHMLLEYSANSWIKLFESVQDFRIVDSVPDVGESTVRFLRSLYEFILYFQRERIKERPIRFGRDSFFDIVDSLGVAEDKEVLAMVCTDKFLHVKAVIKLTEQCGADYANVSIDRILMLASKNNAASVAVIHTHPDGIIKASSEDLFMTAELRKMLETIRIKLIDHYIVSGRRVMSIKQTMKRLGYDT